jgi:hypothetical protein
VFLYLDGIRNIRFSYCKFAVFIIRKHHFLLSSVDGTFIWMKSFHITVSEGTGDPVRRSVSGHPPRRGIIRGEICGMRTSGGARQACPQTTENEQIRPTTRPWFLLSKPLSSSKRDTAALRPWKAPFYTRPTDNEAKRAKPSNSSAWFYSLTASSGWRSSSASPRK